MNGPRLAWLDALRGGAAAVVALFHLSPAVLGRDRHLEIYEVIDLGKYGVLLFFLVSGYVIPMSLERHGDLRRFWTGRLLRIYPAYLLAVLIALALIAAGMLRPPAQLAGETTGSVLGHLTMLQDLLGTQGVLRPFWTLSFEMVFYLIVAGLYAWRRAPVSPTRWAIGLTAAALIDLPDDLLGATAAERRISAVVVTVLLGCVLMAYTIGGGRILPVVGIGAVVLPLLNGHATGHVTSSSSEQAAQMLAVMFAGTMIHRAQHHLAHPLTTTATLLIVSGGVALHVGPAVAAAVAGTFALAWSLRNRSMPAPLTGLGAISYSLYLLHIPVLALTRKLTGDPVLTTVVFVIGSLTAAWACHRWVERPAQALARRVPVSKLATQGVGSRTRSFGKRRESV
ncbi:acyltransferase family protein [Actinoplanes sp. G11-F43]|uniref:acyltransferase family protein n=1 Tax=Actinoplanes sp. G11-F43 TaxID=3424130 RepID=UPI003D33CD06